ncbi:MAG: glycoside hydrolase family 2 TIM barrel-domain containing protein [Lachnospiraceae bacterium]|nr:glycoside hydrolase family 2 TIM barrel-domain containing protein [Lachnospiraceae bacterium]
MRTTQIINDNWKFAKTASAPATLPEAWEAVTLPHTYNAVDGQDGGNDYYRGTAAYVRTLVTPKAGSDQEIYLEFRGAAMSAEVYLNGKQLAKHQGGYSTFRVLLNGALRLEGEENLLCVLVDNSDNEEVYPQKADFTFYGGIYRDVVLITVPSTHFALREDGTPGIRITPKADLAKRSADILVETKVEGTADGAKVTISACGQEQTVPVENGSAKALLHVENVHLWDGVSDPYLYTAKAVLTADGKEPDQVSARFGVRSFRIDPSEGFFLNGRSYPLRGVSRHQDRQGAGNALTPAMMQEDMEVIKDIGANTLRLAHYQHAQEFYDLCDENGIIVWAEIPFITKFMPGGRQNTISQMRELITQSYNHPSIICWGLSNEITASSQVTEELMDNHRELNELCHSLDSTRPTAMAHAFMLEKDSPLIPVADIAGYNLYFGWYLGELEQNDSFFDEYHKMFPDRVMGFTEYGADANISFHAEHPVQGDYSEEYQCVYHEHIAKMIEERPYLWATYVWNLFDFAADGRDEGGKHGQNQKGLVEFDHKTRKDAFYLYKALWSSEPFVHICGRRFVNRTGDKTLVRVYSNLPGVTLYDGDVVLARQNNTDCSQKGVYLFEVPLTGEMHLRAEAGEGAQAVSDEILIRHVEQADASYQFGKIGEVVNWFDKITVNPDYYSVHDTLGTLMQNPATGAVVGQIMRKARGSRGDVAKSTEGNKALEQMLAGMKLESLLLKAGSNVISKEMIRNINETLQKVPKKGGRQ